MQKGKIRQRGKISCRC